MSPTAHLVISPALLRPEQTMTQSSSAKLLLPSVDQPTTMAVESSPEASDCLIGSSQPINVSCRSLIAKAKCCLSTFNPELQHEIPSNDNWILTGQMQTRTSGRQPIWHFFSYWCSPAHLSAAAHQAFASAPHQSTVELHDARHHHHTSEAT